VEHIAARENPIADKIVEWADSDPQPFKKVALDRLGNLVIDSISPNASKGKKDFADKLKSFTESAIYLSQGELTRFLANPKELIWDIAAIRKRHNELIEFALLAWSPDTWHKQPT
jgi:hypothetical protein